MTGTALSTFEAAKVCGVHHRTISRWVKKGQLKAYETPGGHLRILSEDLNDFIDAGKTKVMNKRETGIRVLVVDDEEAFRDSVVRFLGKEKIFSVRAAKDGYAAGRMVTAFKPDLVILDLMMPGINGFEVCRDIRNSSDLKNIKIIVITGYASENNIRLAYESGADYCLAKPVELDDLKSEILEIVNTRNDGID